MVMKKLNYVLAALLALVLTSGFGFAQRGGGPGPFGGGLGKGHGHLNPGDTSRNPNDTIAHNKDTTHRRDTTGDKGKPGAGTLNRHNNPVGLSDSCWNVFLTELSADTAAILKKDLADIATNRALIDTLAKQARAAWKSGDTATARALKQQMMALGLQNQTDWKEIMSILRAEKALLIAVRQSCDHTNPGHKKDDNNGNGNPTTGVVMTPVVPNPVTVGGQASFSYTVAASSTGTVVPVTITVADPMGNILLNVFNGAQPAGTYQQALDLSTLKPGMYLLLVKVGNAAGAQKIMIQ
jgi:hypothetical protein